MQVARGQKGWLWDLQNNPFPISGFLSYAWLALGPLCGTALSLLCVPPALGVNPGLLCLPRGPVRHPLTVPR